MKGLGQALATILNSDSALGLALGHRTPLSVGSAREFLEQTADWCKKHDATSFAITINGGNAVGQLSVSRLNAPDRLGRVGYWLGSEHWGRGIMTAAFGQALIFAKSLGLESVSGHVPTDNLASIRLWVRHGAKSECTPRGHEFTILL
ncbi:MAG: GNAT family N-acetyltransferase [Ignavibacteriales bacterium]